MAFHPSFLPSVRTNGLFCGHPLKRKPGLACGPTDLPVLETLHFTHKFGYFSGGKTNRWHHHLFGSRQELRRQKCDHLLYYFEFQQRGTLHLHMLSSFGFTILLSSEQIFCMYLSHGRMHLTTFLWQIPKHWISPPDHFATKQILSSPIASVRFLSTSATCGTVVTKTCGAILPLSWQPEMSDGGESFRQQGTVVEIIMYHRM